MLELKHDRRLINVDYFIFNDILKSLDHADVAQNQSFQLSDQGLAWKLLVSNNMDIY